MKQVEGNRSQTRTQDSHNAKIIFNFNQQRTPKNQQVGVLLNQFTQHQYNAQKRVNSQNYKENNSNSINNRNYNRAYSQTAKQDLRYQQKNDENQFQQNNTKNSYLHIQKQMIQYQQEQYNFYRKSYHKNQLNRHTNENNFNYANVNVKNQDTFVRKKNYNQKEGLKENKSDKNLSRNVKKVIVHQKCQEYTDEYLKLQEKLNQLEFKINNIKTSINHKKKQSQDKFGSMKQQISNCRTQNTDQRYSMDYEQSENDRNVRLDMLRIRNQNNNNRIQGLKQRNTSYHSESRNVGITNSNSNTNQFVTQVSFPSKILKKHQNEDCQIRHKFQEYKQQLFNRQRPSHQYSFYYINKMLASFRRLDSQDYFDMLFRDHLQQSQQALNFVNSIRTKNENLYLQKQIVLEQKEFYRSKKTLIFDLDETLIHCNQSEQVQSDCMVDIEFPNGERVKVGINIRPFCQEILRELSYFYEIIVFTASHQSYANEVIDLIDPQKQLIQHRLYREHCIQTEEGVYVKDLRIIKNRKIENIILVDNAAYSFGFQVSNGIPILPFYDNKQDSELKDLCNFLKLIHNSDNIQQILNNLFKMNEYVKCQDYQEVVQLYN